jgi:hypothetical protein
MTAKSEFTPLINLTLTPTPTPTRMDASKNNRHDTLSDVRVFLEREAPDRARTIEVVCSSARRDMDKKATHEPFRLFTETMALFPECTTVGRDGTTDAGRPVQGWPLSTTICCWHDCHPFEGVPIPIPKSKHHNTYKVFGVVCSGQCGVAYILGKNTYDQQLQLMLFKSMLIDVFDMSPDDAYSVEAAPPTIFLRMFGGHLDIDAFRQRSLVARTSLVTPPFISYTMVLEESARGHDGATNERLDGCIAPITTHVIRGLRRPTTRLVDEEDMGVGTHAAGHSFGSSEQKPSLFETFIKTRMGEAAGGSEGHAESKGSAMVVEEGKSQRAPKRAAPKGRKAVVQPATTAGTLAAYLAPS